MAVTAFVVGFFTALGWWSANKVIEHTTGEINTTPSIIEKTVQKGAE